MKKHSHYLVACSLMFAMIITERAEAQIEPYYSWFFNKKIHYSQIPQDIFAKNILVAVNESWKGILNEVDVSRREAPDLDKYESLKAADWFYQVDGQTVEERSDGDIYTWPIAFLSKDKEIVFYARGIDPKDCSITVVHGMHLSTPVAYLNMMKIGEKTTPISSCFEEPTFNKNVLAIPRQYLRLKFKENTDDIILFSYLLSYPEVASVVYTQPKSVFMAGQLIEVNSGVNYDVRMKDVPGLSLFDPKTMKAIPNTTIHLEGIKKPKMKYSKNKIYYYSLSEYDYVSNEINRIYGKRDGSWLNVMSQAGTPIYILGAKQSQIVVESQINPADGDVICDLQETSNYICYCGTNKKHGYVGYENPVLVVLDKVSKKAVARYNGNNGKERKDKFFYEMYVLDDDHLLLLYNDFPSDHRKYEIVSLSSLISNYGVTVK